MRSLMFSTSQALFFLNLSTAFTNADWSKKSADISVVNFRHTGLETPAEVSRLSRTASTPF